MAITRTGFTNTGVSGSPKIQAHSTSGVDRFLIVAIWMTADSIISVTYGAAALTLIDKQQVGTSGEYVSIYELKNPASGSNNVVLTYSSGSGQMHITSYAGTNQTTQPDASNKNSVTSGGTVSTSVTSVATDAWLYAFSRIKDSDSGGSFSAGVTDLNSGSSVTSGDSNGSVSPGAHTITNTSSPNGTAAGLVGISIKPVAAAELSVDTLAATDVVVDGATLNGEILDIGESSPDERGFVWGTSSHSDPGDVAPIATDYDDYETESGTFSADTYDYPLSGLTLSTTYYVRAYAHNDEGYEYGDEISFDTDEPPAFRFTNLPGVVFDEEDTQTIYAERLNDMLERLEALE